MQELIATQGLPASGKSYWAKGQVNKQPGKWKRINKDDLRTMLDDGKWTKMNEKFILSVRDKLIESALNDGYSVIVDDTNLNTKHIETFERVAKEKGIKFSIKSFLDVPLDICIERDAKRANGVGKDVIMRMYKSILDEIEPVPYDKSLADCYIFDIDGTLAIKGDRSPYDWHRVGEDSPNTPIIKTCQLLMSTKKLVIILFSGRDSVCRQETEQWLFDEGIKHDMLFMRAEGDSTKDYIIKKEMYEANVKGKFNVLGIFDDRPQVCRMWRELGLPTYQVADPDIEF